jgi:hypothetical protein
VVQRHQAEREAKKAHKKPPRATKLRG